MAQERSIKGQGQAIELLNITELRSSLAAGILDKASRPVFGPTLHCPRNEGTRGHLPDHIWP